MLRRWGQPNGYRQVLNISLPLVASMGTISMRVIETVAALRDGGQIGLGTLPS